MLVQYTCISSKFRWKALCRRRPLAHLSVFPDPTLDHDPHGGSTTFRAAMSLFLEGLSRANT